MKERSFNLRRRLQFRVRTLLLCVTVFAVICGYVGKQAQLVRERKAMIGIPAYVPEFEAPQHSYICIPSQDAGDVSWVRQLFGDRFIRLIAMPVGASRAERQRVAEVFPEAKILAYRPPYYGRKSYSGDEFFPFTDEQPATMPETH